MYVLYTTLRRQIPRKFFRIRHVSTLSKLAQSFNTRPARKLNVSFRKDNIGLFGIPELTDYGGFYLLQEKVKEEVEILLKEITSKNRKRKMVEVFDDLSDCLCRVADMADFIRVAHPDSNYRMAAEDACVNLSGIVESLNTNVEIYEALKSVIENGDVVPTDSVDNRVAELFKFDFEQSGITLSKEKREEFVKLNENILILGSHFIQGTHKPGTMLQSKLPPNLRNCFSLDGDKVTVNSLFSDHYSDMVREAAYRIFLQPDHHQEALLEALLSARHQLAKLVGFPTYAHRATRGTIMENPENVMQFLKTLSTKLKTSADQDYNRIKSIKQNHGGLGETLNAWDPPYYTAIGRQQISTLHSQDLAPYFSLGTCMEGLNNLFTRLYGVTLEHVPTGPGEVWTRDIHKIAVKDEENNVLGYIYCDLFERPEKPNQDCHYTIQGGRQRSDGSYQLPMVVLQLNLPYPQSHTPSLLTPGMLENLFHEFGHAMHSMLGRTRYQHVTGTRCPTDFAEVPSVLMEFFVSDPRVLSTFAKHFKTGESLPSDVIQKLCQSKNLFSASDTQLQVFYSVLDQTYHGEFPSNKSTTQVFGEVQNKYYSVPYVEGTAWQLKFGHLVGYGAKYYSYLLSRAVASNIWYKCFYEDPFNRTMGDRYRYKMLAFGGEKQPKQLTEDMLNESPTIDGLVGALIYDIEHKR